MTMIAKAKGAVLEVIRNEREPIGPMDILATVDVRVGKIDRVLHQLLAEGAIRRAGRGRYTTAPWPKARSAAELRHARPPGPR
jgi:hypothetical protein